MSHLMFVTQRQEPREQERKRYDKQTRHSVCHRTRNDNLLCLLRAPGDGEIEAFQASCLGNKDMIERERERERSRGKWINGIIFTLWGRQSFLLYFIFPWPLHPILHTHDTNRLHLRLMDKGNITSWNVN